MDTCEKCGKKHDGNFGSGRFCSRGCANSRIQTEAMNNARRQKLSTREKKFCEKCGSSLDFRNITGQCWKCLHKNTTGRFSRKKIKFCKTCEKKLSRGNASGFCSSCSDNGRKLREKKYIKKWIETEGLNIKNSPQTWIRKYILNEQDGKCDTCGIEHVWCNENLVFVLDHIDGNSDNNNRNNLRLLCPNCNSQTPTFCSKNKGNGNSYRNTYRKQYYHGTLNL